MHVVCDGRLFLALYRPTTTAVNAMNEYIDTMMSFADARQEALERYFIRIPGQTSRSDNGTFPIDLLTHSLTHSEDNNNNDQRIEVTL